MNRLLILIAAVLLFTACAPELSFTWTKEGFEGKKYKKIAIFSFSKNLSKSAQFQDNMVKYLTADGYTAVSGMAIMNPLQMKDLKEEDIVRILLKEEIDAVLSVILVDKETSVNYVQGSNYGYGGMYGGYGGFGGYYGYRYGPAYYDPGHYQESKSYLLENHFYEVIEGENKEEALVWASQSTLTDPSDKTSKVYAKLLLQELKAGGILK
ncbi:MAG: hypothetical protein JXR07_11655 [Reichenbachiella sp.]